MGSKRSLAIRPEAWQGLDVETFKHGKSTSYSLNSKPVLVSVDRGNAAPELFRVEPGDRQWSLYLDCREEDFCSNLRGYIC